jgi:hypothetical protein
MPSNVYKFLAKEHPVIDLTNELLEELERREEMAKAAQEKIHVRA